MLTSAKPLVERGENCGFRISEDPGPLAGGDRCKNAVAGYFPAGLPPRRCEDVCGGSGKTRIT